MERRPRRRSGAPSIQGKAQGPWLLAVDVGNTHVTLGAIPEDSGFPRVAATWRLATRRENTSDEYGLLIEPLLHAGGYPLELLSGVSLASVVPPLDEVFTEVARARLRRPVLAVGPGIKTGVRVLCDNPAEVGADRIVNAAAAFARTGRACIVVDFGTATTFDCVDGRGAYRGGAIAPGPRMAAEVLAHRTAKLPHVGAFRRPARAIGTNTVDSILSGLFFGYVGLTRGLLARLRREMGGAPFVLATGGLAGLLGPAIPEIKQILPDLTLEGLGRIWRLNHGAPSPGRRRK